MSTISKTAHLKMMKILTNKILNIIRDLLVKKVKREGISKMMKGHQFQKKKKQKKKRKIKLNNL